VKVIIDAYNLFHWAQGQADPPASLTVGAFVQMISRWADRTRNEVLLVFDGASGPQIDQDERSTGRVAIRFVGPTHTADSAIIEFVNSYSAARTLWVVSTDRQIRQCAKRRKCKVLTSDQFWDDLTKTLARSPRPREPREKHTGLTTEETQYWLEEFGLK